MGRPPRDPKTPILTKALVRRILFVGLLILAGAFGLYEWELALGSSLDQARTVAVAVVVVAELFYLFNCRSLRVSPFRIGFSGNRWALGGAALMIAAQAFFTYAPVMNRFFSSAPVGAASWLRVGAVGLTVFLAVEAEKALVRRRDRPGPPSPLAPLP